MIRESCSRFIRPDGTTTSLGVFIQHLIAVFGVSAAIVICATILWGWPGVFSFFAVPPGILLGLSLAHALDAWTGRVPLRPGFLAMGLALGSVMAAGSFVGLSAVQAPRTVSLERRAVLAVPVDQVWSGLEEPIFWMRWDGLIGELTEAPMVPGSSRPTYDALLKLAGRNVPARLTLVDTTERYQMAWDVAWTEGSVVEGFRISVHLTPRGASTEVTYAVDYHLPTFGARLANTLALESGVKEGMDQSVASLERWTMEQRAP